MVVLYDGEIYSKWGRGGITRYFDRLISGLPSTVSPVLLTVLDKREHSEISNPRLRLRSFRVFRPRRLSLALRSCYLHAVPRLQTPAVAHPTYYSLLSGGALGDYKCPVVLTVHDMIHELFAQTTDPDGEHARIKRRAILAADIIICVSEHTRKDLETLVPEVRAKDVRVIPLAPGIEAPAAVDDRGHAPPYFLYVGNRASYKNFPRLLKAISELGPQRDFRLHVVGSLCREDEAAMIGELGLLDRIHFVGKISDGELAAMYRSSVALVYPSLYEGFGIPPLEAMVCGTAVIAANSSSIPEVVGEAALLFDPCCTEELSAQMARLLDSPSLRTRLIEEGAKRVERFSWAQTVASTWQAYADVVSH